MVPAWFSCPDNTAMGRWLWKTGDRCNDVNNRGRKTETFDLEDYRKIVQATDPTATVHAPCTESPEQFISCFDFAVVVPTPQPTPQPTPPPTPPLPTPQPTPAPPTPQPTPA